MAVINRIAEYFEEMKEWRRYIHAHPELDMECHGTAAFVVERLRDFGVDEIHEKIGVSGCCRHYQRAWRGADDWAAGGYGRLADA